MTQTQGGLRDLEGLEAIKRRDQTWLLGESDQEEHKTGRKVFAVLVFGDFEFGSICLKVELCCFLTFWFVPHAEESAGVRVRDKWRRLSHFICLVTGMRLHLKITNGAPPESS